VGSHSGSPAEPRWHRLAPGWRRSTSFVVFLLAGGLFATSALASQGNDLRAGRQTDLAGLVVSRERHVQELEDEVNDLRAQVDSLTKQQAGAGSTPLNQALAAAKQYAPAAGLAPAVGTAITVTLDDASDVPAPGSMPDGVTVDDYVVHQQDLEAVVNALWAGGAEAMMLMDQRVIATSAVRCVGTVLSLQGRTYSPPYTISAIGDVDALRAALDASQAVQIYREYADELGLRYSVATSDRARFPAYDGGLSLLYAKPGQPEGVSTTDD
jgi:uncharacterized protein YlxW (UPF0749 family)